MKKRKQKNKEWLKRKQKKRMRQLTRKKNNHYSIPNGKVKTLKNKKEPYALEVPKIFSLSENSNETVKFFDKVFDVIKKCEKGNKLFFNLSSVERVTPDAIMYLIAVVNNAKIVQAFRIQCSGSLPRNDEARQLIEKVGFFDYVKVNGKIPKTKDPDRIRIMQGFESSGLTTSIICDFVNEKMDINSKLATKRLYPLLVEMMTNVKQHAYKDSSSTMIPKWYVYVENCESDIQFIFLDSGSGIPNTIRKNWTERLKDFINGDKDEPTYIEAALKGAFRTETNQGYRGKGLPEIYNAVTNPQNRLSQMTIISGHARCDILTNEIKKEYIYNSFEGSLFMWRFKKGDVGE